MARKSTKGSGSSSTPKKAASKPVGRPQKAPVVRDKEVVGVKKEKEEPYAITIGEALRRIDELRNRKAVFGQLVEYLEKFLPTDTYAPKESIAVPIGLGSFGVVPDEFIREMLDELQLEIVTAEKLIYKVMCTPQDTTIQQSAEDSNVGKAEKEELQEPISEGVIEAVEQGSAGDGGRVEGSEEDQQPAPVFGEQLTPSDYTVMA